MFFKLILLSICFAFNIQAMEKAFSELTPEELVKIILKSIPHSYCITTKHKREETNLLFLNATLSCVGQRWKEGNFFDGLTDSTYFMPDVNDEDYNRDVHPANCFIKDLKTHRERIIEGEMANSIFKLIISQKNFLNKLSKEEIETKAVCFENYKERILKISIKKLIKKLSENETGNLEPDWDLLEKLLEEAEKEEAEVK